MTERRCEQCENCFKHEQTVYCSHATKNCNGRHVEKLLTCARCKEVRYCSRACQRAQWREHKSACDTQVQIVNVCQYLGDRVERTFKGFAKFAKNIAGYLELPAISALQLYKGKDRIETNCLFVTIRAKETIFRKTQRTVRGCITFKVEKIEGVTMKFMHEYLDYRSSPWSGPEMTEKTLAHRKGLMRIFVRDVSGILPAPLDGYTLPTDIANWPKNYHLQYDPHWEEKFYESIGQRKEARCERPTKFGLDGHEFDIDEEEEETVPVGIVPPARPSSPNESDEDLEGEKVNKEYVALTSGLNPEFLDLDYDEPETPLRASTASPGSDSSGEFPETPTTPPASPTQPKRKRRRSRNREITPRFRFYNTSTGF